MNYKILSGFYRHDILNFLSGNHNIGIELGVAEGVFSTRMINSKKFRMIYGIDMYADHHNTDEYIKVLKNIGLRSDYKLLRLKFDEALSLFDDNFFDFIYVDGYAENGEEDGKTIIDWYKKLKKGGILAGDDYYEKKWPLVVKAVNNFSMSIGAELMVTELTEKGTPYCKYPSWAIIK